MQIQVWALALEYTKSTSEKQCKLYTDSLDYVD